jgi:hypothetical protein
MKTEPRLALRILQVALLLVVLSAGVLIGRSLDPGGSSALQGPDPSAESLSAFRVWMWQRRALDVLIQAALIFAGALAVAAILPSRGEFSGHEDQPDPPLPSAEVSP